MDAVSKTTRTLVLEMTAVNVKDSMEAISQINQLMTPLVLARASGFSGMRDHTDLFLGLELLSYMTSRPKED